MEPLTISAFALVWCRKLTQPGMIFGFIPKLLRKAPDWAKTMLYICPACFAGQLALWSGFLMDNWTAADHWSVLVWAIFLGYVGDLLFDLITNLNNKLKY